MPVTRPSKVLNLNLRLAPHELPSPRRILSVATQREYKHVAVIGFHEDGTLELLSTPMECRDMLWAAKSLEEEAMFGPATDDELPEGS